MVAAIGYKLDSKNIHIENLEAKSKHYLKRMRLFKALGIDSKITIKAHEASGRFIPVTQIRDSIELTNFLNDFIPLLHLDPKSAETIKYIISELVRNVIEHAHTPTGAIVSAQYYAKSNSIKVGIADTGNGIRHTIGQSHQTTNDLDAIRLALTPGITGTTIQEGGTAQNAGAGLYFIKSIAMVNKNFFMVYSGNSMYKLLKSSSQKNRLFSDPFKDRHSKKTELPYWHGTVVGVDLSLDQIAEFSQLLQLIRTSYTKAIKDRKALSIKRPKFI
jgi:anti-sigma regulatory factor (Ser/Thr protein kinase)